MSVKQEELETPERGMRLNTRGAGVTASAAEPERKHDDAAAELADMRDRIAAARRLQAEDVLDEPGKLKHRYCRDCFGRGRDAAIAAIERGKG